MDIAIITEIRALKTAPINELRQKYSELFNGQKVDSDCNKIWLWRKIAYKMQELGNGCLSTRARREITDLIAKYDPVNNKALRPQVISAGQNVTSIPLLRDKRLPIPGTIIRKQYKGQDILVKVLEKGFEYNRKYYKSLTAVVREITGAHWSGYIFFDL